MRSHNVALTVGLSMQRHHQHEIPASTKDAGRARYRCSRGSNLSMKLGVSPLIGVGFALLPHVICCGLAKMEPPDCDLGDLLRRQGDPWRNRNHSEQLINPVLRCVSASDQDQMFFSMEF